MSDSFTFNGVNSATWLARVFPTDSMLKAPAHNYSKVVVPGRSGALLIDIGSFDNVMREYDVQITGDTDLASFAALRAYLASSVGYLRLTDTFEPDYYFMAAYTEPFDMTADFASLKRGRGTISFDCKPQRWLISGETETVFTANGTITNPTRFASKPLLRVTTTRSTASVVGIGECSITIKRQGVIYIDCETGRAYTSGTPLDSYISLSTTDFPTLPAGDTGISLGTGISRVAINPRWFTV